MAETEKNEYGGYGNCGYFATQDRDKLSEWGKIGGKKSGETKRRKKEMKELLEVFLDMPLHPGKKADVEAIKCFANLKGRNVTTREAMLIQQVQKAMKGDIQAMMFIRDTIGEKPTDSLSMDVSLPIFMEEEKLED